MAHLHICSPRARQTPLKLVGLEVGVKGPSGPVEVVDWAQPLLLPLCRERTGGKEVPEGDPGCIAGCREGAEYSPMQWTYCNRNW